MNDKNKRHFQIIQDAYWEIDDALESIENQLQNVLDDEYRESLDDLRRKFTRPLAFSNSSFERWLTDYSQKYNLED